ncbi:hypothetical protein EBZ37_14145 [bacterium]|nr:hypothetical protein [bacterium]
MRDSRGTSLVEALVAAGALAVVALAIGQQLIAHKQFLVRQQSLDAEALMVQSIIDQAQKRIEVFPKSFTPVDTGDYPAKLDELVVKLQQNNGAGWAYSWSQDVFVEAAQCPECPGRALYIINQAKVCGDVQTCDTDPRSNLTENYQGLYRVRLVLFNEKLFRSPPHAKEYFVTVTSK